VGKSTLFNRLLRKRRAITDPTPGVTRDPVAAEAVIAGRRLRLVDTGGFRLDSPGIDSLVAAKTLETIESACSAGRVCLIALLLEAGEITAEDEEFIALLRPYRERLLVLVNKCEGGRREAESWNLLKYGLGEVMMISAEHGDNIAAFENRVAERLKDYQCEASEDEAPPIRIAIIGKPNTGKSTLSNRLTSSEDSIVSEIPGTTRDVIEGGFSYKNRRFRVLDTAGIRRRTHVEGNIEYYSVNRAIKSLDEADLVFLMIDGPEGFSSQDKKIAALAHEKGRGIIFVLNKWDLMPQVKNTFAAVSDRIRFLFGQMDYAPILPLSALTGEGVAQLLDTAISMYRQLTRRTETAALNQALERWQEESPPPSGPKTRFRLKYGAQVSDNPVKFVFFASRPQAVSPSYEAYLRNRLRKDLGYAMIPVQIELRSSAKKPVRRRKTH
jgi:GTP-binding protein